MSALTACPAQTTNPEETHDGTQRKCSSCGKFKALEEFTGRATCDACRTRKRLKSTARVSERRETLNTIQLENQWLNNQLNESANQLKASELEVIRLTELLRTHAVDVFREHVLTRQKEETVSSDSAYEENQPLSSNSLPPQNRVYSSCGVTPGAAYTMQQMHQMKEKGWATMLPSGPIIQSEMPSSTKVEFLEPESKPAQSRKRKEPDNWQAAEVSAFFASQFVDEIDELRELSAFFTQEAVTRSFPIRPSLTA